MEAGYLFGLLVMVVLCLTLAMLSADTTLKNPRHKVFIRFDEHYFFAKLHKTINGNGANFSPSPVITVTNLVSAESRWIPGVILATSSLQINCCKKTEPSVP